MVDEGDGMPWRGSCARFARPASEQDYTMARSRFGTITQRERGVYCLQWWERGKRKSKTVRGTAKDARDEMHLIEIGLLRPGESDTFDEYWEKAVEPTLPRLAPNTRHEYTRLRRRELSPRIGGMRMRDATWRTLQDRVIDDIRAPSVQRSTARVMSKVFGMAVRDHVIASNPCSAGFDYRKAEPQEKVIVDTLTVSRFLSDIRDIKYEPVFLLMLGGGLRMEEASVMRWEDISIWILDDRAYAVVQIRKTLVMAPRKTFQDFTKTPESCREMVIGDPFASRLLELAEGRTGPVVPSGKPFDPSRPEAEYTSPETITHNWRSWVERENRRRALGRAASESGDLPQHRGMRIGPALPDIPYVRPGDMRTCWSTMQGEAESPDSIISLAMGHSDGTTRGSHYLKSTRRLLAIIADNLQEAIENADADLGKFDR